LTVLEILLLILCVFFACTTAYCAKILYRLGITVLDVEDSLEDSLELMDERIQSMDKILEIPLFSDSAEIKKIHRDMQSCRDAIVDISNVLTSDMKQGTVEDPLEMS
jgi:hypothetical protein